VFDDSRCLTSLGGGCGGTDQSRIGVVMTAIPAAGRLWTRSTLWIEPSGSNMKAPGIAGSERSSPTYTRTARSSARRRFTHQILTRMSQEHPGGLAFRTGGIWPSPSGLLIHCSTRNSRQYWLLTFDGGRLGGCYREVSCRVRGRRNPPKHTCCARKILSALSDGVIRSAE
jgi:hypothetical protein